ncbi:MAG TPA: DUF1573 domain-containing protein, partial [Nitrosopumilaceae archaeon]|nr:DUF1573 domain-containing protein [Nitrosopumilaceae archaeon]
MRPSDGITLRVWFKWTLLCVVLLVLATVQLTWVIADHRDRLNFQNSHGETANLGSASQEELITRLFSIRNEDKRDIIVTEIKKSCSCASVELSDQYIKAHETTQLHLQVQTAEYNGKIGGIVRVYWRYADQTTINEFRLGYIANVKATLIMDPSVLDFGTAEDSDAPIARKINLSRLDSSEKWDSICAYSVEGITKITLLQQSSNRYELWLKLEPQKLPIGHSSDDINVYCYNGKSRLNKVYVIPVSIGIMSDVQSKPDSIYLGLVYPKKIIENQITLRSNKDIKFISIKSTQPSMIAKLVSSKINSLTFEWAFQPINGEANQSGKLLISILDDKKVKVLAIPF